MASPIQQTRITFGQSKNLKKFFVLTFLLLILAFPDLSLASSATSVVETQVEGEAQVYSSIETTVDGQTVKKESTQPGKLELKVEKTGESEPTVTFNQEETSPSPTLRPTPTEKIIAPANFVSQIMEFVQKLLDNLTSWFK